MAAKVQDVLMIEVVIVGLELLRTESEITVFSGECGEEFAPEFVPEPMLIPGEPMIQKRVLRLPRDRIILETSASQTRVRREYPDAMDDVALVVRLLSQAIASSDIQDRKPSAFGFNTQIVYDQDSGENAIFYLGRRLFVSGSDLHENWSRTGGFGKLVVSEGPWQWTMNFEPRLYAPNTTKVFLNTNLHVTEARLPDEVEMKNLMEELWRRSYALIDAIDGRGDN